MSVPTESTRCHTVLVVDGQELVADSLARAIDAEDDLVFVGSATTVSDACRVALEQRPDVVIIDSRLPDGTGLRASAVIRQELPDTGIVMLSSDADGATRVAALESGSVGFASKTGSFDDLIDSIRQVATGDIAVPPTAPDDQLTRGRREGWSDCCGLTRREFEVLQLLADGCSTNYIVDELVLSVHTVRNHIRNILAKLGAQSRLEAVAIATRLGLVRVAVRDGDDDPETER
jgi:DNA-binding NarL/FixJ family response regulator